jgi:predicted transposase/invertase (TIGR01784 family)
VRTSLFNDTIFKIAFGTQKSRPALISLLNEFLDLSGDRLLDLKVRNQRGIVYNVELQARSHPFYAERTLLYWASAYSNQILSGGSYQKLRKTVHLSLLNFKMFSHQNPHSCFKLYDLENKLHLTD